MCYSIPTRKDQSNTLSKLAQPLDLRNPANLLAYITGQHPSTFPRASLPR